MGDQGDADEVVGVPREHGAHGQHTTTGVAVACEVPDDAQDAAQTFVCEVAASACTHRP